jgi:hypothetical protein
MAMRMRRPADCSPIAAEQPKLRADESCQDKLPRDRPNLAMAGLLTFPRAPWKMSFDETPLRRLRIVRACGLLIVALVIGMLPFALDLDREGIIGCYAGCGFCMLLGILNLWLARRASPDEFVSESPERAPVPVQIRYYRRALWISAITFPVMTIWVAYDLHQSETGAAANVQIWAPLVPIYEHFGYWPTVLSPLLLGVACCVFLAFKIRKRAAHETIGSA